MDVVVVEHKDSTVPNDYYSHNNIIEFVVDSKPKGDIVQGGNVNLDVMFGAKGVEITKVYAYEEGAMIVGTEWQNAGWVYREYNMEDR